MTERVLAFDRKIIKQDTGYWCGPASAQVALSSRGKFVDEATLARECGTTTNGTDNVGKIERVLDVRMPEGKYLSVYPGGLQIGRAARPANVRRDYFWWDVVRSIDNGFPVILNWVVPPSKKPIRATKGSPNPTYGGGTTYHYVTCVGWSDEPEQALLIADSGFWPNVYWVPFETAFQLIHADAYKGYAFADHPVLSVPPGVTLPPGVPVKESATPPPFHPPPLPAAPPAPAPKPAEVVKLSDPKTRSIIIPNSYRPRNMPSPLWAAVHTSEGKSNAVQLTEFCRNHEVAYNRIVDDRDIVEAVADPDAPWAAVGANKYAYHLCFSHSFASWSRDQWLDPNPNDGYNEDKALTNGARQMAYWCQSNPERPIPVTWIGNGPRPPWGATGICGHVDFGGWGGGHTDPGVNFPVQEFLRRVAGFLTGIEQPPLVPIPPVVVPGTNPDAYADWLLYQGNPNNNPDRVRAVQSKLKRGFASYAGHLEVDGDYGPLTKAAVAEFQRRSHLVADGIVGRNTAAALKP